MNVVCELRFDGPGGLLRGTWEIADGGTGQPLFPSLELYSNFVVGRKRVRISRTFTASGKGRHIVRFRVAQPRLLSDQVAIQFYVGVSPSTVSPAALPSPVTILGPPPNSVAGTDLDVSWADIPPGATHVLVEFSPRMNCARSPVPARRSSAARHCWSGENPSRGWWCPLIEAMPRYRAWSWIT